jgi:hypothetical protein
VAEFVALMGENLTLTMNISADSLRKGRVERSMVHCIRERNQREKGIESGKCKRLLKFTCPPVYCDNFPIELTEID